MSNPTRRTFAPPQALAALVLAMLASASALHAQTPATGGSLVLIPSIGITKSTDTNAGDAKAFGGLALRASVLPMLKLEGAIAYRQDSYGGNTVKVRQWPVTASLWLAPLPALYLGGGVGWYRTTFDYASTLPIKDTTTSKAGLHLGGGVLLPIAPRLGLDLNGRYVFMTKDKASFDVPTTFNPDFWTASLGLAIQF